MKVGQVRCKDRAGSNLGLLAEEEKAKREVGSEDKPALENGPARILVP